MYSKKFPRKAPRIGKITDVSFIEDEEGGCVPVASVDPYKGIDPESLKPINVLRAGGTLKPAPKINTQCIDELDRKMSAVENLINVNADIKAKNDYLASLRESLKESEPTNSTD